jgi:hypothetical protein
MMLDIASLQQIFFYFVEYPNNLSPNNLSPNNLSPNNLSPTNLDYPDYLDHSNKFQQSQ